MRVRLQFEKPGYIANPYWPEMYRLIEIQKRSGLNRARSEANRRRALEAHLVELSMTLDQYHELEQLAQRPFHMNADGKIIIPGDRLLSCLVNACDVAPAKLRIPNTRCAIRASDFVTDKTGPDGVWERFAVVQTAQGKASNQRGYRASPFIVDFVARGTLECEPEMVEPKAVLSLLSYAGRNVGIGASRKMGWGRFTVAREE